MCGILGIYKSKGTIEETFLNHAIHFLSHRGPDGQGIWLSENKQIAIGHRRLNIVDILGGSQPLFSEDNKFCTAVNGEFYDDLRLRNNLKSKGYQFKTKSDSELVLYLYQEYGLDFIHQLRGEFSFILYDDKNKRIIGVRDRFGIKPLCYHLSKDHTLYIASEAKAIFAAGIRPEWNNYALYHAFCFQYLPQNQTLFQSIYQLPPGHLFIFDGEELKVKRYWDLNFPSKDINEHKINKNDFIEGLDYHIKEAISLRLRADNVSICCHLSGGIDSASIASIASQIYGKPLPCFSVSFSHKMYDETEIAQQLAQHINAEFYPILVDEEEIIDVLADAVYYSEGLAINNHLAAKYILNREIKKLEFKIALTGEGSDEIFAGYPHLKQDFQEQSYSDIFQSNFISNGVQISNEKTLPLERIKKQLGFIPSFIKAKSAIGYKLHNLLDKDFKKTFNSENIYDDIFLKIDVPKQLNQTYKVYQSSYLWIKFTLAGYILKTLGDGCEMAHGIEGRVPFLDHILFDFVKNIPLELKINKGVEKYILRETVKNYITPEIYSRQKHPFMSPPLSFYNNQKGLEFINDCLRSVQFQKLPFYNAKKVISYLDSISNQSLAEQIASEPVIMLMLTSFLLSQGYNL